jgi:hypothetical protein
LLRASRRPQGAPLPIPRGSREVALDARKKSDYFDMIYGVRRQLVSTGHCGATVIQLLEQATGNK